MLVMWKKGWTSVRSVKRKKINMLMTSMIFVINKKLVDAMEYVKIVEVVPNSR